MTPYAGDADLVAFLPDGVAVEGDAARLLTRSSELLDGWVRRPFAVTAGGLPADADIAEAMRDACCAQVEFWLLGPGEEHDVEGLANRQVSIGHLSMAALPPELAPRARRILSLHGLLQIGDPVATLPEAWT